MAGKQDSKQPSVKERYWRDVVQLWQRSGQTVRVFCVEHHLSEPSFYAWRRLIASRDRTARGDIREPLPAFVPVRVTPSAPRLTTAPPRLTTPLPTTGSVELVIGAGRVLRVNPGFDPNTLRQLLTILEEPAC